MDEEEEQHEKVAPGTCHLFVGIVGVSWAVERSWQFGVAVLLADLFKGKLAPLAVILMCETFAAFFWGIFAGPVMSRPKALFFSSALQSVSVMTGSVCLFLLTLASQFERNSFYGKLLLSLLGLSVALNAVARTTDTVVLRRLWVPGATVLHSELARLNALLARVSLLLESVAPLFVALCDFFFPQKSPILLFFLGLLSLPLLLLMLRALAPRLRLHKSLSVHADSSAIVAVERKKKQFCSILLYLKHPMALSSIAFCCLFASALTPSGLLSVFLLSSGLPLYQLALFRALSAISGALATLLTPQLIFRLSLPVTALAALLWQFFFLIPVTTACWLVGYRMNWILFLTMTGGVVLSRLGLWVFDLSHVQLMQMKVTGHSAPAIHGAESALSALCSALPLLPAFFLPASRFPILAALSAALIFLALLLFALFYRKERKKRISAEFE